MMGCRQQKPKIGLTKSPDLVDHYSIMLVGFDIGLDELGSHQFDGMSQPLQLIGPEVGRGTGLHADQAGWNIGKKEAICERLSCLLNNRLPCSSTP